VHVDIEIGVVLQAGQPFGPAAVSPAREDPVQVFAVFRHDLGQALGEARSIGQRHDGQPSGHDIAVQLGSQFYGCLYAAVFAPVHAGGEQHARPRPVAVDGGHGQGKVTVAEQGGRFPSRGGLRP